MKAMLLAALAGLAWGVGEVFTKAVLHSRQIGPITAVAVRSLVALPVLWIAAWVVLTRTKTEPAAWLHADRAVLAKLVFGSGLIAGALALLAFFTALSMGEISRVKPVAFALAPATAVVLGWLALGEPMTLRKALGVALILAGVLILTGAHGPLAQPPSSGAGITAGRTAHPSPPVGAPGRAARPR